MTYPEAIFLFRRYLRRRNYSLDTVRNYVHRLDSFFGWVEKEVEEVEREDIGLYIDHLQERGVSAKTINCHLVSIRQLYGYLYQDGYFCGDNPVPLHYSLRTNKPLPRYVKPAPLDRFLSVVEGGRDRAMFLLMLRCGLRVREVAHLRVSDVDFLRRRIEVKDSKWGKSRLVYLSAEALEALGEYLRGRSLGRGGLVFLVEKPGPYQGKGISVRGIQKRMEYYARKAGVRISCHQLRHTMATSMLDAGASPETIQELLGHSSVVTTQGYCRISDRRVEAEYFSAMARLERYA